MSEAKQWRVPGSVYAGPFDVEPGFDDEVVALPALIIRNLAYGRGHCAEKADAKTPAQAGVLVQGLVVLRVGFLVEASFATGLPACAAMNSRTCGYTCVRQRRPLKMP